MAGFTRVLGTAKECHTLALFGGNEGNEMVVRLLINEGQIPARIESVPGCGVPLVDMERIGEGDLSRRRAAEEQVIGYATLKRCWTFGTSRECRDFVG